MHSHFEISYQNLFCLKKWWSFYCCFTGEGLDLIWFRKRSGLKGTEFFVSQWKEDVMTYRSWSWLLHGSCGLITQTKHWHGKKTTNSFLSCWFFFLTRSKQGHNLAGKLSKVDQLDFPCLDHSLLSFMTTTIGLNAAKIYKAMKICITALQRPRCHFLPSTHSSDSSDYGLVMI